MKTSISDLLTMPKPLTIWITINWKILKEMGIPDHLTCLLRNLYAGQEVTVRTGHGTTDWFQIGKGVHQGCILSLCLCNLYEEYIIRNAGLEETQARIKIAGRNINNLRYADDTTLMAESEEELKCLLMKVKEENDKVGLKLNIQKTKIMASGPIASQQMGKQCKQRETLFWRLQNHCRWWLQPWNWKMLALGRKAVTNLDSILKSKDITCQPSPSSQSYCISSSHVWMWELEHEESWALKNWYFWIVALEKTLESPFNCKEIKVINSKGNRSWIFIGRTDAEIETSILWSPDVKNWLIGKDPYPGKD